MHLGGVKRRLRPLSGGWKRWTLTFFCLGTLARAETPTFFAYLSDTHSQYSLASNFIETFAYARQQFLRKYPNGKCVVVHGGDVSGVSEFSIDKGQANYQILAALSRHCQVIVLLGNHEALDFRDKENPNLLFIRQNEFLASAVTGNQGIPFKILSANVEAAPESAHLFAPYRDVELGTQSSIRVIGLTLDRFFDTTVYDHNLSPKLFTGFKPTEEAAWEQVQQAAKDGKKDIILAMHDDATVLFKLVPEMKRRAKEAGLDVRFPIALASHDHEYVNEEREGTWFLDPKSHYRHFFTFEMSPNGGIAELKDWSPQSETISRALIEPMGAGELEALKSVGRVLTHPDNLENQKVIGETPRWMETKQSMRGGRTPLGTAIAETHRIWASSFLMASKLQPSDYEDVLAFYNSRSYRREFEIPAGDMTTGTRKSIYDLPTDSRIGLFTGAEIQTLYQSLRAKEAAEGVYNPQMSMNVRVNKNGKIEIRNGTQWKVLAPDKKYVLALDGWLAANGYGIAVWKEILSRVAWLEQLRTGDVLQLHLNSAFSKGCVGELERIWHELSH